MTYSLIGLSGKAGAGKDYLAQHYFRPHGYQQLSFAWLLKWVAIAQGECTWEEAFLTKPPHVRDLLQRKGTEEWRRDYGSDCWARGLDAVAQTWLRYNDQARFVIADARFPNELEAVRALGGDTIRVVAPTRVARNGFTDAQRHHPSETALDHIPDSAFSFVVNNDIDVTPTAVQQLEARYGGMTLHLVA
jgi:hypothetical protein